MITYDLLLTWMALDDVRFVRVLERFAGRPAAPRAMAVDDGIALHGRLWIACRALWCRDKLAAQCLAVESASSMSELAGSDEDQAGHAALADSLRGMIGLPTDAYIIERRLWSARWNAAHKSFVPAWNASRTKVAMESSCNGHIPKLCPVSAQVAAWDAIWDASRVTPASAWFATLGQYWAASDAGAKEQAMRSAIATAVLALGDDADGWIDVNEVAA